jgi:5-methylcytosine-specific restriction endonuclease McrA
LDSNYTKEQWEECKNTFDNKCAYCGKNDKLSQEHFVPVSKGGEYTENNIIPSCKSCNSSKNNSNFFDWYPKQEFYSKIREQNILKHLRYDNNTQQLALI